MSKTNILADPGITLIPTSTTDLTAFPRQQGALYYDNTINQPVFDNGSSLNTLVGGADTALSNLAGTAVNVSIVPGTPNSIDLGSIGSAFANLNIVNIRGSDGNPLSINSFTSTDVAGIDININPGTPPGPTDNNGGNLNLYGGTPFGNGNGGTAIISGGPAVGGSGGNGILYGGSSTAGSGGGASLQAGSGGGGGAGGPISINGGTSDTGIPGDVQISGGTNIAGDYGDVVAQAKNFQFFGHGATGRFLLYDTHINSALNSFAAPSVAPTVNAGTGANASVSGATDVAGSISLTTTNVASSSGQQVILTFANPYGTAPRVVLTPTNAASATIATTLQWYANTTLTQLIISFVNADVTGGTYTWDYHLIQTY